MRAHQIMTKDIITVTPHTAIEEAAKIMLETHISGLPVMDDAGRLVGIVSESDFLRRGEIGTGRKRPAWLQFFMGPGKAASEFIHERGRKVEDIMTKDPTTVGEETPAGPGWPDGKARYQAASGDERQDAEGHRDPLEPAAGRRQHGT
jgi:CBS-domain-containing membrane protein